MEFFSYRWRLAKLQNAQRRDELSYQNYIGQAEKGSEEEQSRLSEWFCVNDANELAVARLQTSYLRRRAEVLLLPVPEISDKTAWEDDHGIYVLNRAARNALRAAIRKEEHERVQTPLALLGGLTGLGGMIVAIIALLVGKAS